MINKSQGYWWADKSSKEGNNSTQYDDEKLTLNLAWIFSTGKTSLKQRSCWWTSCKGDVVVLGNNKQATNLKYHQKITTYYSLYTIMSVPITVFVHPLLFVQLKYSLICISFSLLYPLPSPPFDLNNNCCLSIFVYHLFYWSMKMPRVDWTSWLTDLCNKVWRTNKMPNDRTRSTLACIYKNKDDAKDCSKNDEYNSWPHYEFM